MLHHHKKAGAIDLLSMRFRGRFAARDALDCSWRNRIRVSRSDHSLRVDCLANPHRCGVVLICGLQANCGKFLSAPYQLRFQPNCGFRSLSSPNSIFQSQIHSMKTNEIREKYLDFFVSKGHTRVTSDVLVPKDDPSVLFTPAGMNQFKDHFLGRVKLEFTRATTCQTCLRTGDINNVGRTAYHHTFFEMLGNFSFGDYFKREAIHWAWEFLTDKKWLGIDSNRLNVTVYKDDSEAAEIWKNDIGLADKRIGWLDEDDNFWPASAPSQGPDGVCGPCSEIFYVDDAGKEVEIWNLVFTQFNRKGNPPNNLEPLPSKNIDTGMGLERIASVMQNQVTNYHIDILRPIVEAAAEICGVKYDPTSDDGRRLRRITDHIRACTFAIHENVEPDAKQEAYVVRRLLRRATLDGHQMGMHEPFLYQLVPAVVEQMSQPYPELRGTVSRVQEVIKHEESSFLSTLDDAVHRIDRLFRSMKAEHAKSIEGSESGMLYTTYGVPPELLEQMGRENEFEFDWGSFQAYMDQHGKDSGAGQKELFETGAIATVKSTVQKTDFVGYESTECSCVVKAVIESNELRDSVSLPGSELIIVLDQSPFYGESGGQIGDEGVIENDSFRFKVTDTKKASQLLLHLGTLESGTITQGEKVKAIVDKPRRQGIQRAHTATHILHYALQTHLGEHAQQRGSKVEEDVLRFDFKNNAQISAEMLEKIEDEVHSRVADSADVDISFMPLEEARKKGAMMLFGEKYPDVVRVVSIGQFSKELCGGMHLLNSSEVGSFEIDKEEAVSAGTRRIVALTGEKAKEHQQRTRDAIDQITDALECSVNQVPVATANLVASVRDMKKQLSSGKSSGEKPAPLPKVVDSESYTSIRDALREVARLLNVSQFDAPERIKALSQDRESLATQIENQSSASLIDADQLIADGQKIDDVNYIVREIPNGNPNLLRQLIDQVRSKQPSTAIMLVSIMGSDKVMLVAGMTKDLVERGYSAGNWVKEIAPVVGGGGGGKPDLAQAGGKQPEKVKDAIHAAQEFIRTCMIS
jgi:alanyl-tRNA synthetase